MPKRTSSPLAGMLIFDRDSNLPLYEQLCRQLRKAILNGQLAPGTRLPASRPLAEEMAISRTTIVNAYEQLSAEGYLHSEVGAGTFVAPTLPEEHLFVDKGADQGREKTQLMVDLGVKKGTVPSPLDTEHEPPRPFQPGIPALDAFPLDLWRKSVRKVWRRATPAGLTYGSSAGYRPLREAITEHLSVARGVHCQPEQVLITHGSQQGLSLVAKILLRQGEPVWMENPGFPGARESLRLGGGRLIPVPIDDEGLDLEAGARQDDNPRMIFVTPSHQYPLGITMSLPRRLALLEWADEHDVWILEDDYDSEFRYSCRPIPALQGLARSQRVIYMGTFSKSLFPGLRLGYLVLPEALIEPFVAHRSTADRSSPTMQQAILADFMAEGHFTRHIRQMRLLYKQRQDALLDALQAEVPDLVEVQASDAGLHLIAWLKENISASQVAANLAEAGIYTNPVSAYELVPEEREGLVLGYGCSPVDETPNAVKMLKNQLLELRTKN